MIRASLFSLVFSFWLVASGNPTAPRLLATVLPTLSRTHTITLIYDWGGLNRGAPYHVETQLAVQSLPRQSPLTIAVGGYWKPKQTQTLTTTLTRAQWVEALAQLALIALEDTPYQPTWQHRDDFPTLVMQFQGETFTARFQTTSQGDQHLPWEAIINGRSYTIRSEAIFRVWEIFQPTMQPEALAAAIHAIEDE